MSPFGAILPALLMTCKPAGIRSMMLTEKVAIVTGASRGLGAGIARALALEGASVAMFSRDMERLSGLETELAAENATAVPFPTDVSESSVVQQSVEAVRSRFGRIDILANNAGIAPSIPILEMADAARNEVFDININGTWNCARAVLPVMIKQRGGRIINVSSITGPMVSGKNLTAYSASKGALSGFTRALALEVAEHGITVNAILPGTFDTPMMRDIAATRSSEPERYLRELGQGMPLGRLGTPEDIGDLAVFLASDRSRYITGTEIVIDGGNAICEH